LLANICAQACQQSHLRIQKNQDSSPGQQDFEILYIWNLTFEQHHFTAITASCALHRAAASRMSCRGRSCTWQLAPTSIRDSHNHNGLPPALLPTFPPRLLSQRIASLTISKASEAGVISHLPPSDTITSPQIWSLSDTVGQLLWQQTPVLLTRAKEKSAAMIGTALVRQEKSAVIQDRHMSIREQNGQTTPRQRPTMFRIPRHELITTSKDSNNNPKDSPIPNSVAKTQESIMQIFLYPWAHQDKAGQQGHCRGYASRPPITELPRRPFCHRSLRDLQSCTQHR
jgi:hypothetical protein